MTAKNESLGYDSETAAREKVEERAPISHELKTQARFFRDILSGRKRFEHRIADRDFRVGDTLYLAEYDGGGDDGSYSGGVITARVRYVLPVPSSTRSGDSVIMTIDVESYTTKDSILRCPMFEDFEIIKADPELAAIGIIDELFRRRKFDSETVGRIARWILSRGRCDVDELGLSVWPGSESF